MARQAIFQHPHEFSDNRAVRSRKAYLLPVALMTMQRRTHDAWALERDRLCLAAVEKAEMVRPCFLLGCASDTSERLRHAIQGHDRCAYFHMVDQYIWRRMSHPDVRKLRAEYGGTAIYGAYMSLYYRGNRRLTPVMMEESRA